MKSIKLKLIVMIVSILFVFAFVLILANTFFLDNYYVYKTKSSFIQTSESIKEEYRATNENILKYIQDVNTETGYKIEIVDDNYEIAFSSAPEFDIGENTMIGNDQKSIIEQDIIKESKSSYYGVWVNGNNDSFVILIGRLNKEEYIVITQPLGQITKNAEIANDFLLIIGLIMLIVASSISIVFAKRLIKPILDITKIADSIAKLDFSQKYTGNNKDEIGDLGISINNISYKLNNAIDELKQNNELLIKEMKLQKRFIASVSHEFNTPVGLIRGYSEALQMGMYENEQEKMNIIDIIIKEADRLNHLVNDILLIIKLDSKTFSLNKQNIDISRLLTSSMNKIDIKANEKSIKLESNIANSIFIDADPMRITQVVDNLLSNAIIHTPQDGEISVTCSLKDDFIKVSVNNTGSSIADEDKEHLFDAFYRAQDARSRKKGGSGLGFSIVNGIVSAHGGECSVDNIAGGVSFWFTLF